MSTQILFCHGALTTSINSCFLCGNFVSAGTLESMPTAGSLGDWYIALTVAPGAGTSRTFTIQKNGVDTALTITISNTDTTGSYTGTAVAFSAGDTIRCVMTRTGAAAACTASSAIAFTPTVPNENIYAWFSPTNPTLTHLHTIFSGRSAGGFAATFRQTNVTALAGTITKHRMTLFASPGAGKSHTFALRKNTVVQDGSGGTVDTRVTISDANFTGVATFSLAVAVGDQLDVSYTANSGSPTAPGNETGSILFVPTVAGAFQVCQTAPDMSTAVQEYAWINNTNVDWSTTQVAQIGHASNPRLTRMQVVLGQVPGAAPRQFTLSVQKGGSDVLSLVIGPTDTTGSANASGSGIACLHTDTLQLSAVPANTPTANNATQIALAFNYPVVEEPTIETLSATNIRSTSATLRGRIDPNGFAISGHFVWWICAESPPTLTETDPQSLGSGSTPIVYTESLTGLLPSTTYCYRAVSDYGSPALEGEIKSFTTSGEAEFIDGTVSHPLTWLEAYLGDEDKAFAEVDLNDRLAYYLGYKAPWVLQWHRISRGTSDRAGQIEHMSFGARFSDTDRYFRGRLGEEATRYLTNKPLVERMIDDEERRREGLPRVVANGYVSDYSPEPDLQFDLTGTDWLKKKFTRKRRAQQSWQPNIDEQDFPECPRDTINTACPIVLGHMSDADVITVDIGSDLPFDASIPKVTSVMAHDLEGAGDLNGWVSVIVTAVIGGSEGPISNVSGTHSFNRAIKAFWNSVPGADSYRIYFYDAPWGHWIPHGGVQAEPSPTYVRMLTHDTTPGDGDWGTTTLRDFGIVFASASDGTDVLAADTASVDQGHGLVKPRYVGIESIGSPPEPHHVGIVSRCAMKEIVALYLDGVAQDIDTSDTWKVPGHAPWAALFPDPYEDRGGQRYTLIYGKVGHDGPDRMAGRLEDPTVPSGGSETVHFGVTLSVLGVETNGDTTGDLIVSGPQQAKWLANNFIAPDTPYQSGPYLVAADTQFPHVPGLTLVDEATFDVADEASQERIGGSPGIGYEGAGIIGEDGEFLSAIEVLARLAVSYDFDWIWNRKGQLGISMEPIAPVVGVTPIDDVISIVDRSFRIEDQVGSDFFNIHPYVHTRDYVGQTETGWKTKDEVRDESSITNYDQTRESPLWELYFLRDETDAGAATIADVMQRKRARFRHPRRRASFRVPLSGLTRTLGEAVPITHIEGIGASGWEGHQVRIVRDELDPNDNTVVLECYDLETVFEGSP